jgi:Tol biopolymer transport system component
MKRFSKPFSQFCCAVILSLIVVSIGSSQDLGPILYHGREVEGLCSISGEDEAVTRCTKLHYEEPSWQPHGNRIVAVGKGGVVFLDMKGRLINRAVGGSGFRPIWSPDGQYVYAISYELGRAVERWDAFGRNRIVLPVTGLEDQQIQAGDVPLPKILQMISFSPSGKRAALLTRDFKEMLIADVSDQSLSVRKVLPQGFNYVAQSVWLDDDHLLFIGKQDSTRGELWELDVQTGTSTRRGIDGLWLRDYVALSPDGKSVVVTAVGDGDKLSWNLWRYSLETSHHLRLTTGPEAEDVEPSWRH